MARTNIPVTTAVRAGVVRPAQVDADLANGNSFTGNDGTVVLEVTSSDAGVQTVSVVPNPAYTADGLVVSSLVLTVPAGAVWLFGPFNRYTFAQDANGLVYLNPSVATTLKFRCYKVTPA